MKVSNGGGRRINSFALVSYLAGPMAHLLDEIRHDFAPDSRAKAHVTILPPRPLEGTEDRAPQQAIQELNAHLHGFTPFTVEFGEIEVFQGTEVIYVSIQAGFAELERMHTALNTGILACDEPHPYHPHVTVVQELASKDIPNAAQYARWRWSEFKHPRAVNLESLTFVQNTLDNCWTDLASLALGSPVRL